MRSAAITPLINRPYDLSAHKARAYHGIREEWWPVGHSPEIYQCGGGHGLTIADPYYPQLIIRGYDSLSQEWQGQKWDERQFNLKDKIFQSWHKIKY